DGLTKKVFYRQQQKKVGWTFVHSYYQKKTGRHWGVWRKRWAVLQGSILYTFKEEKQKKNFFFCWCFLQNYENPTEIIDLKVFSSVKSSEDRTNRKHSFDVYSPDLRHSLVATSESEKEDWIRHIGKAIVLSNKKTIQKDYEYGGEDDEENDE
ncbi:hypothetical protein RFI_24797, partial [Reticulomyxa filosa]